MRKIAVDVDDVISPFFQAFIDFHNKNYGTSIVGGDVDYRGEYSNYWGGALNKLVGIPESEGMKRLFSYLSSDRHIRGQEITDDAKNALLTLKDRFELEIVTARHYDDATVEWLNSAVPDTFKGVHFIANRDTTKADVCLSIGADYLIDDSVDHCNLAAEAGIKVLLFGSYGWNSHQELHEGVTRVEDWHEVMKFFESE